MSTLYSQRCRDTAKQRLSLRSEILHRHCSPTSPQIYHNVSVLFVDMRGYSTFANQLSLLEQHAFLHKIYCVFDAVMQSYCIQRLKTNGDQYIATAGTLPIDDSMECPAIRICRAALKLQRYFSPLVNTQASSISLRTGIATGEVAIAPLGHCTSPPDFCGLPMIMASRLEQRCQDNHILVCKKTYQLARQQLRFSAELTAELKGLGNQRFYHLKQHSKMRRVHSHDTIGS